MRENLEAAKSSVCVSLRPEDGGGGARLTGCRSGVGSYPEEQLGFILRVTGSQGMLGHPDCMKKTKMISI